MSAAFGLEHFARIAGLEETYMHVLVVEDDPALGQFLKKALMLEGHDVRWVADGDAGLQEAILRPPDLMVLDLSLPLRDGIEVLEALSGRLDETAVLVLTGRSQVDERVRCLNLGADDCLLKPFSLHELSARCRAILRRRERFATSILRHAGMEINRIERVASFEGQPIDLTSREFALLESLLRRRGACCSRAELLAEVWQASPDATANVVDVYINYLRRKLAAVHRDAASLIQTVRGSGYRLCAERKPPMAVLGRAALASGL
jgi:DNA-binding response OmpR family regulator